MVYIPDLPEPATSVQYRHWKNTKSATGWRRRINFHGLAPTERTSCFNNWKLSRRLKAGLLSTRVGHPLNQNPTGEPGDKGPSKSTNCKQYCRRESRAPADDTKDNDSPEEGPEAGKDSQTRKTHDVEHQHAAVQWRFSGRRDTLQQPQKLWPFLLPAGRGHLSEDCIHQRWKNTTASSQAQTWKMQQVRQTKCGGRVRLRRRLLSGKGLEEVAKCDHNHP